jgi:endo-1,4-beta-xylanase
VCDADKCRANGCNASNCAYTLTRFIVGSTAVKGQVFVDWDSDSLDVRFEMLDATPFDDQADSALNWQDDSIEIYVDLNNAKTATYQADDFQINVPRLAGNNVVGIGTGLNTGAVTVTRTSSASGYTLIIGIPWTALNNAAYPSGKTIGFDVAVNDDSDGGDRNSQIMLYGSANNWNNTSQFGTLTITP